MAVLVFGLIVIFGYREITNLMEKQQKIDLINFENELKDIISRVSSSSGDVKDFKKEPLRVPSGYSKICFIELGKETTGGAENFPIILNSWDSNVEANVFLVKNDVEHSFYADNISINPSNSICIPVADGKLRIRLEGIGGSAKIS